MGVAPAAGWLEVKWEWLQQQDGWRSSGSSSSSRMAGGEAGVAPAAGWLEVKWE